MDKLIAYFSANGTTARKAKELAEAAGADVFEIKPLIPYTSDDLNWRNKKSRSSLEMMDETSRPEIASPLPDLSGYSAVYIGFPIWWGVAPRVINTFIENEDLKDKDVVIFATSGGSGIDYAMNDLRKKYPDMRIKSGQILTGTIKSDII